MAVEYGGFIYVLSHLQGTYRLDIYSPGQAGTDPISTTSGFNAAKIAVDFWRKVYALNHEAIPMAGGAACGPTEAVRILRKDLGAPVPLAGGLSGLEEILIGLRPRRATRESAEDARDRLDRGVGRTS